jgi:hypothetical protein
MTLVKSLHSTFVFYLLNPWLAFSNSFIHRTCHGGCVEEKEENFVLHVLEGGLLIMERHYSRRNRSAARGGNATPLSPPFP